MTNPNDIFMGAAELDPSIINDLPMDPVAARAAQLKQAAMPGNPPVAEPAAPETPPATPDRPATDPALDSLLVATAEPAAPAAAPDPAPAPAAPAPGNESVPLSRLNEVLAQREEDRNRIAILERMVLEGRTGQQPPAAAPTPPADDPNIDPQLEAYFSPYIDKMLRERGVLRSEFDGFRQTLQPVAQQQEVAQLGTVLAKVIPGFDPSNAGKVVERLNGITDPQEQALYAGSAAGAVALAQGMMLAGEFAASGPSKPIPPRAPVRPGADVTGTPSRSEPVTDENMARRLAELPQADFDALLQRQLGHTGNGGFTLEDLLPRS